MHHDRRFAPTFVLACTLLSYASPALAQEKDADEPPATAKERLAKFNPLEGTVKVGTVAEAKLSEGWLFLAGADGRHFLEALGNHPGSSTLGVAIPPEFTTSHSFAVYSYADDGHVNDDEDPDYDQLLADMKESTRAESAQRKKLRQGGVELLGWAEPPHYDKTQHKLFWAEKLKFEESDGLTLNYNVRILGRTGHLVVNGVGGIDQLALVAEQNKHLLSVTEFVEGQRYENFNPAYDKVAAYGIGGLIAGKIALKIGLFAKFAGLLKVAFKPILAGVVIVGAAIAKIFTGRKKKDATARA